MNRKEFLKRFGIGLGVAAVAPKVIQEIDFKKKSADKIVSAYPDGYARMIKDRKPNVDDEYPVGSIWYNIEGDKCYQYVYTGESWLLI